MAEIVGLNGLHNLEGFKCDLCGLTCDPQAQELNALDCTFSNCPSDASVYHQDCLEKYLKSIKLEKSRKTGFKCPRGCGKGSAFDQPCPGKITKSHPIHIRNDESKKRKKALPPPPLEYKPKTKEKGKEAAPNDKGKEAAKQKDSPQQDKGKAKAAAAAAPAKCRQVLPVHNAKTPAPSKQVEKQQIENIRREIAAKTGKATAGFAVSKPAVAKEKDLQMLHEYEAHKEASQPKMNAWGARNNAARVLNVPIHQPLPPPPPPPPPKPQPSVPVVSSWASAARLPVQAAASAKPKAAAVNGSVRAVSIWSTQQEHGDGQPPPPPPPKKVTVLVGGELAEPEGPAKITKAQKKNLKRLERKALQRAATDTSVASSDIVSDFYPDTISEADNEVDTPLETRVGGGMSHLQSNDSREDDSGEGYSGSDSFEQQMSDHQRCLQALMATKARWLLGQLQVLGFPDWQCAVAVLRHGSNLHDGVAFLLEDHVTSEEQSRAYMASAVDSPDIDISEELQMLAEAQSCLGLPISVLERAVADTDGDIQAAVEALLGNNGGLKADTLHSSHSEGPSHPQSRPSQAASQSDMKQRRSSADTTSFSSLPFPTSQPKPTEQSTIAPNVWGGQASQAQSHSPLPNDGHAGLNSWSPQQQSQQQHQQQQMGFSASAASYAAWHKQPADTSPFAAAALQPPPPPPKQAPPSPPLPRPVELPATLELPASLDPQLQLGLRDFVPAGSAGLLSTKLGQQYSDPTSSGFLKPSQQQQQPQQQSKHADLPLGSRLSSYTSAASRSATPKANAESSSWNGSLDSSASYAAVQGLGQQMPSLSSFSMFSGPSGPAAGRAADLWGSLGGSSAQMASLERYNQLLQQSPGGASGRSSLDSSQAPFPGLSATAQRQAYLPSLSPGSTVSQASFNGYAASTPGQQQPASWGMLPMHSSAQSIWSSTPADRLGSDAPEAALFAAAAVAADVEPRRGDASGRDTSDADLELDSLMATLMCT